jgi:hypothetical protein
MPTNCWGICVEDEFVIVVEFNSFSTKLFSSLCNVFAADSSADIGPGKREGKPSREFGQFVWPNPGK